MHIKRQYLTVYSLYGKVASSLTNEPYPKECLYEAILQKRRNVINIHVKKLCNMFSDCIFINIFPSAAPPNSPEMYL